MRTRILPRSAIVAATAAPGEVKVGRLQSLDLSHLDQDGCEKFANEIAAVAMGLASFAPEDGGEAVSMNSLLLQSGKLLLENPRRSIHDEIQLPIRVDYILFARTAARALLVTIGSWVGETIPGSGLDEVDERIRDKTTKLDRWPDRFDQRWLILPCVGFFSRTSVRQAKESGRHYPNTGFDRIYLMDNWGGRINFIQLNIVDGQ